MYKVATQIDSKKFLGTLLAVSLLIHFCVSFVYFNQATLSQTKSSEIKEKAILKILMNEARTKSQQIVQTETSNNKKSNKPRFLSQSNNHFDRESRAANDGKFKAAAKGVKNALENKNYAERKKVVKNLEKKLKKISLSDLGMLKKTPEKKVEKVAKRSSSKKGLKHGKSEGVGLGSTNDFLEEIPLGDFTRLNSQEFEFYGFYHRIRQKLEQFWGLNIQDKAEKIFKQGRSLASESNLITSLSIKLNKSGEIVDIKIKGASGIQELDEAAIESFNQAGPFPNPPTGMLGQDGRATIEWGFVVNT